MTWHGVGIELADGSHVVAKKQHAEKLTGASLFRKDASSKSNYGYVIKGIDASQSVAELKAMLDAERAALAS